MEPFGHQTAVRCGLTVELSCGSATPTRPTPDCRVGLTESAAERAARQLQRVVGRQTRQRGEVRRNGASSPHCLRMVASSPAPSRGGELGSAVKRADKAVYYHAHAELRLHQRGVDKSQVAKTLRNPDSERPARRPGATRFEKALSRRRRLAVIAIEWRDSFLVLSAFWI